jgi:hypothetical protein
MPTPGIPPPSPTSGGPRTEGGGPGWGVVRTLNAPPPNHNLPVRLRRTAGKVGVFMSASGGVPGRLQAGKEDSKGKLQKKI